jgi:hypothetical protein
VVGLEERIKATLTLELLFDRGRHYTMLCVRPHHHPYSSPELYHSGLHSIDWTRIGSLIPLRETVRGSEVG